MGDPVCWLHLVCDGCGLLVEEEEATACPRCGASLGSREDGPAHREIQRRL